MDAGAFPFYSTPSHHNAPEGAFMEIYLRGAAVGLAYLAPIGLQNLFVIHSALFHPRRRAMLVAAVYGSGVTTCLQ